ncbi:MAG: hypothetical protein HYW37_01235 [Candidatus Colwellbacteria bacterium]|nr:hypothetical protein [Candidatus Colwellbacteria bacterium]
MIAAIKRANSEEGLRTLGEFLCETEVPLEGIPPIQQAFQERVCELFPTRPAEGLAFASRVVDGLMAHAVEQEEKRRHSGFQLVPPSWDHVRLFFDRNPALCERRDKILKQLPKLSRIEYKILARVMGKDLLQLFEWDYEHNRHQEIRGKEEVEVVILDSYSAIDLGLMP